MFHYKSMILYDTFYLCIFPVKNKLKLTSMIELQKSVPNAQRVKNKVKFKIKIKIIQLILQPFLLQKNLINSIYRSYLKIQCNYVSINIINIYLILNNLIYHTSLFFSKVIFSFYCFLKSFFCRFFRLFQVVGINNKKYTHDNVS